MSTDPTMRYTPQSPAQLVEHCVELCLARRAPLIVGIDGAAAAAPVAFAHTVAAELRARGRSAAVVDTGDYLRPASLRLEWGANDEHTYRNGWYDFAAIRREVVDAVRRRGQWLPRLWDAAADRSYRDAPCAAGTGQVLIVAGPMVLRDELDLDVGIALQMSAATLRRLTADDQQWTINPLLAQQSAGRRADVEVRYDHPQRPAVRR